VDKETKYIVVVIVVLGIGLLTMDQIQRVDELSPLVSGYGGITAEIIGASAKASEPLFDDPVNVELNGTTANVDPVWSGYLLAPDPTIVECEIQGKLNIIGEDLKGELYDSSNDTIDNHDGTYTHKTWEVRDVYLDMGVTVRTKTGGGNGPTYDAVFTIKLDENEFSVFEEPDEVIAYILEVYTLEPISSDHPGKTEGTPASGGFYFPLETLGKNPVPQWIVDGGYEADVLGQFAEVSFQVKADYMEPTIGWWERYEHELNWKIGATARVFGYWEDTGSNKEYQPPGGEQPWWEALFAGIGSGVGDLIRTITMAVIVILIVYVAVKLYRARGD
jgi:hypothetical protein